jgi:hypothetical protein
LRTSTQAQIIGATSCARSRAGTPNARPPLN